MRCQDILELNAGHGLIHTLQQREQRMVVYFLVLRAFDLIEPELNVGDVTGDGVDCRVRPVVELAHRLRGINALRATGLVDGQCVATERFSFEVNTRYFCLACSATVAQNNLAASGEAFEGVDWCGLFAREAVEDALEARHRFASSVASRLCVIALVGIFPSE